LATRWIDATLVPFVSPQGDVYRYLLARSDVTQQVMDALAIERLRKAELDTASTIQSTLLVPPLPHCPAGVSVAARFSASGGVAGDFHELLELRPGVFDVLLGDVMGKGVPAGLIGAAVKLELARCLSDLGTHTKGELAQPAAIVRALHQRLTPRLMALDSYVTLSYLRIEPGQQRLTSVGCGHPQTLVVHDGVAVPLPNNNLPLGVLPDETHEQTEHPLPPGATVVMYSDGLTEATDAQGNAFGPQRLAQAVCELSQGHADARLTADGLLAQVHAHVLGDPPEADAMAGGHDMAQADDQTLVLLRIPDNGEQLASLPRSLDALTTLRHTLATCEPLLTASNAVRDRLCLAAVEAFSNTVRHGHATTDDTTIGLAITHHQSTFTLELTDIGTPYFPPDEPTQPDPCSGAEGGYGLSLIKAACDDVHYLHQHGINRCRLGVLPNLGPEFAMSSQ
jgi:serine phosphatase RsbU (regulator of sigma subunit)/anti-sigma regulatory factor (Ser/Thr protein kinase)